MAKRGIIEFLKDREKQKGRELNLIEIDLKRRNKTKAIAHNIKQINQALDTSHAIPKTIKVINPKNKSVKYYTPFNYQNHLEQYKLIKDIRAIVLVKFGFLYNSLGLHQLYYSFVTGKFEFYRKTANKDQIINISTNSPKIQIRKTTLYAFIDYINNLKPTIPNMYLPTSIYNPKDILMRLPIPEYLRKAKLGQILGVDVSKMSLLQQTMQFYTDLILDYGHRIQLVTPVVAEVVKAGDETKLIEGAFVAPKTAYWTPVMVSQDLQYFYFMIESNNLGGIYTKEQADELFEKYRKNDLGVPENMTSKLGNDMNINASLKTVESQAQEKRTFGELNK